MPLITPASLSLELQVDQKRIRNALRELYGTLPTGTTRWELSEEQADAVRSHFPASEASKERQWTLEIGDIVRRREIHDAFRGQQQGGISTPKSIPAILIFTDPKEGAKFGYDRFEGLREDGSYSYTGEGQEGHHEFLRGNKALRDAAADGKTIRLFRTSGTMATYVGAFTTGEPVYRTESIPDAKGAQRLGIIFNLVPIDADTTLLPPYGGERSASPMITDWTEPRHSDTVVAQDELVTTGERVVSRVEFELQADFGRWLKSQGHVIKRLRLPTESSTIEPDLYVESNGWIVEAKKSSGRAYVRTAIGQVLDYAHIARRAGLSVSPVVLLPGRPDGELLQLMGTLDIVVIMPRNGRFDVIYSESAAQDGARFANGISKKPDTANAQDGPGITDTSEEMKQDHATLQRGENEQIPQRVLEPGGPTPSSDKAT
ncbi:hypothetical protein IFU30_16260 [Plantibacter sp. CFBP 8798]|uniref:hypothetical protein n=1 Tax=Plantibacter sp. CFBP 8798 TaxID=2775268 RepID=UPI00177ACBBF|nr:hypothetical protein [Plantibacter sp. CFBP 8798]MBD8467820.1 hypothetical protein [Plantibacter sp. CFBP 8798]